MHPLFSEAGYRRLDELCRTRLLCAFDFDGTLAPIVTRPENARLPLPVLQRLAELTERAPVAIITGRSLEDISARLEFVPDFTIGNHGLEGLPGQEGRYDSYRRRCLEWQRALSEALDAADPGCGIEIENKGISLSVHYRLARDHAQAVAYLQHLFDRLVPAPHIVGGKCVFNLLPHGAGNKGMALEMLMRSTAAESAVYVGDDVTDEDIFRMRWPELLSIRVERSPDTSAEFYLYHRLDIVQLLDALIDRLKANGSKNWLHHEQAACTLRE